MALAAGPKKSGEIAWGRNVYGYRTSQCHPLDGICRDDLRVPLCDGLCPLAAQAPGARLPRILGRELLPNLMPVLLSYAIVMRGVAILAEAALGFLGGSQRRTAILVRPARRMPVPNPLPSRDRAMRVGSS